MTYQVVAPLALVKDAAGRVHYAYAGARLDAIDGPQTDRLLAAGCIEPVDGQPVAAQPAATGHPTEPEASSPAGRPARVATKTALVEWLVTHADFDREELDTQSKDDLWALIDASQ